MPGHVRRRDSSSWRPPLPGYASDIINRNELRIIGLSRSGNHALMHWICCQRLGEPGVPEGPGRQVMLNCVEGRSNPYWTARPMDDGRSYRTTIAEFDLAAERTGEFQRKDLLIFNHEDSFLAHACSDTYEERHDEWVGRSEVRRDVLLLRDPLNLFASRLRTEGELVKPATAARIWKQHAREFLGKSRRLRHRPVLVNYNRWCVDREYRAVLAAELGLGFTDEGVRAVPRCAGGSAFDGLRFDGRAHRMRVLERWRACRDDPRYRACFDPEMLRLSEAIFGEIPGEFIDGPAALRRAG